MVLCKLTNTICCVLWWKTQQWLRLTKIYFIQYYKLTIQGCIVQRTWGPLGPVLVIKCPFWGVYSNAHWFGYVLFQMSQRRCHSAACYYIWTFVHDIEEIVTDEYRRWRHDTDDKSGRRHWQTILHCVQRMPFGACQNGGNHWYLIFIKYHHDTSNCILKMFLKNYSFCIMARKMLCLFWLCLNWWKCGVYWLSRWSSPKNAEPIL